MSKARELANLGNNYIAGDLSVTSLDVAVDVNVDGSVDFGDWTITESAGVLYFATGGVNTMKLDASGNITTIGDITGFGTI